MLAGNVNANVSGEQIFIRGDQFDNQIRIFAIEGNIRIAGLSGTTINGQSQITVENSEVVTNNNRIGAEFFGGLRIHMGPGNDLLFVDGIRLNDLSVIYGGTGDDSINIANTDFFDTAVVQTFDGDDSISINDTQVTDALIAVTLEGDDSLSVQNTTTLGSAILTTGNGNDAVRLVSNQHQGTPQFVLTQNGDDTVEIVNPIIGTTTLEIYTGSGDDNVSGQLNPESIAGDLIIAGQTGTDLIELNIPNLVAGQVSLRGFEFNREIVFQNAQQVDDGLETFVQPDDFFFVADFVELDETTSLSAIDWLGSYEFSRAPTGGDNFVIEIYLGGTNQFPIIGEFQAPVGDPIATFNIGDDANRINTGQTWSTTGPERDIFSYSADIDFTLQAGTQYWISIYSIASAADVDNVYYTLAENIQLDDVNNGAATVRFPGQAIWTPNTTAKTHFTLRS